MTIKTFLKELRKAKIQFFVKPYTSIFNTRVHGTIRTCGGKCPIEAFYRYKTHRSADWMVAAEKLGMSTTTRKQIVRGADSIYSTYRQALLKACGVKA
jgi:hypothetical protein